MALRKYKSFADYKSEGHKWITLATGEYYPDILKDACELYKPVLVMFGQMLKTSESSIALFMKPGEERLCGLCESQLIFADETPDSCVWCELGENFNCGRYSGV